ncbi:unnamed protein product [Zymoseptoria tritici ST99CH_3D1]|nr:unnamed protein product [Zymoseptoria tritici ST99CH_3D1]
MADENEVRRKRIGVYTKTVVRSSACRWVLRVRIRNSRCNDVVFVGEDFVRVKQVGERGHLHDVATKTDFDAHIRAAAVFDHKEDDFLAKVKVEAGSSQPSADEVAPQSLVLTLDSHDLVFVYLETDHDGSFRFVQQTCPMPCFDRVLFQPGEHLAVDPSSRAVAVAANEAQLIVYVAKPKKQIQSELQSRSPTWIPVSAQRPMQVTGVIQTMEFLVPPDDDEDHVVLLLVVIETRQTKAVRIDWYHSVGPAHAQIHPGQPLDSARNVPNLLVPLREASFLLVTGNKIVKWANILSGHATDQIVEDIDESSNYPGISGQAPLWVSWAKPPRTRSATRIKDHVYLVREDGLLVLLTIGGPAASTVVSQAGNFACHVGSAFASLGDEGDPDILAVAGETSSGLLVSMGVWPSYRSIREMTRVEATSMNEIDVLPNWASITDMISSGALHSSKNLDKAGDTSLVTSGRQPYGTITELRRGVRAHLLASLELEGLRNVTDFWTIPNGLGGILVVLSSPTSTRLVSMPADPDSEDINEVSEQTAFDWRQRTLTAGFTLNGRLIQVTSKTICATPTIIANFEDTLRTTLDDDVEIIATTIIGELSVVVAAEKSEDACSIVCYSIPPADSDEEICQVVTVPLGGVPLCLAAVSVANDILIVASTQDRQVAVISLKQSEGEPRLFATAVPSLVDPSAVCDHIAILKAPANHDDSNDMLAVCGFRDGKITVFNIDIDSRELLNDGHVIDFGNSTVKLMPSKTDQSSAVAMSGASTCLLSWNGQGPQSLSIENIWITDTNRSEFAQGSISACAQMPESIHLSDVTEVSMADALVMISGDDILVASTTDQNISTIPRQMNVSGTPNRLIYSKDLRCLVCASLRAEVRMLPSDKPRAPPEEKRQLFPTIDFIPMQDKIPTYRHDLQPGERIYVLLEWTIRQQSDGKKHTFILVGGQYVSSSGKYRGRITFLQPVSRNWEVKEVREMSNKIFGDPVYSMCMYDSKTYVACSGNSVFLYQLSDRMSWDQRCPAYRLNSPGVHITVETDTSQRRIIVVSTVQDSLVILHLTPTGLVPISMGPVAQNSLSHYTLPPNSPLYTTHIDTIDHLTLLTTKTSQLLGLAAPKTTTTPNRNYTSLQTLFSAPLPKSLTRLVPSSVPTHRGPSPAGVIHPKLAGCATDGSLFGILLIDEHLWRRLTWLQKLISWSEDLSPHSYLSPTYTTDAEEEGEMDYVPRVLPIGLQNYGGNGGGEADEVVMHASTTREEDMHVDGDVLGRVLRKGGVEAVRKVLEDVSVKEDAVGGWVRTNLEREMENLEEIVELVRKLQGWVV